MGTIFWLLGLAIIAGIIRYPEKVKSFFEKKPLPVPTPGQQTGNTLPPSQKSWGDQAKENIWTILLVIIGLAVFFLGMFSSTWKTPGFTDVGNWTWGHWMQILVLAGIVSAILKLNKKALGDAEPILQKVIGVVLVSAFFICPALGWFADRNAADTKEVLVPTPIDCDDATENGKRTCMLSDDRWSNWIKFADGPKASGKQLCGSPVDLIAYEKKNVAGTTFWRFKSRTGSVEMEYKIFPPQQKCPPVL